MASNMRQMVKIFNNPNTFRLIHTRGLFATPASTQNLIKYTPRCIVVYSQRYASTKFNKNDNEHDPEHKWRLFWRLSSIVFGSSCYLVYQQRHTAHAESPGEAPGAAVTVIETGALHKSDAGFKERKIIEYENRIRSYSTPDKTFRYFASLQDVKTGAIYMTPEDFVRALTPDTMQPKGLGLDQFKKIETKTVAPYESKYFGEDSIFHSLGEGGLISFSDYVFLLTVLGTSARHIEIAFKMFDINGDGEVEVNEFKKVSSLFLNMSSTGSRHRDRGTTGNVLKEKTTVNVGLTRYFFGREGQRTLKFQDFLKFKRKLQEEVMFLEFKSFVPKNGTITERQFAEILLTYANFQNAKRNKILKRIKKVYAKKAQGVKFDDYLAFFKFLINIRDVEMALSFHTIAGQAIDKQTFKQVAKTVARIDLSDHLIDIVFCIFDEDEDEELSNKEFISVMKDKMFRGLNKPKDTGFTRLMSAMVTCAKINASEYWFGKSS